MNLEYIIKWLPALNLLGAFAMGYVILYLRNRDNDLLKSETFHEEVKNICKSELSSYKRENKCYDCMSIDDCEQNRKEDKKEINQKMDKIIENIQNLGTIFLKENRENYNRLDAKIDNMKDKMLNQRNVS